MKFGVIAVDQSEGAILAHSVSLNGQGRLRKGRVIAAQDVQNLQAAGVTEVTAACLEEGDVHEDEAALALARAFVPDEAAHHVQLTAPFTGRVNVIADGPGVVVLDEAAIAAVNAIDPMITIATVPAYQQMHNGGMVATIKIIAYSVRQEALDQACAVARGQLRLAPPVLRAPRLIVTDIPGGIGDKGWKATEERTAAFGLNLPRPETVPHRVDALAEAITLADGDLIMILTGSATSDIADVAPQAVVAAGGTIKRFGMPVDPGNLLFVADLKGIPVIGLPGCARSPALNGADWVMSRILCGLEVTDADIAGMGVGGLLKEIPTRPQPRRGTAPNTLVEKS